MNYDGGGSCPHSFAVTRFRPSQLTWAGGQPPLGSWEVIDQARVATYHLATANRAPLVVEVASQLDPAEEGVGGVKVIRFGAHGQNGVERDQVRAGTRAPLVGLSIFVAFNFLSGILVQLLIWHKHNSAIDHPLFTFLSLLPGPPVGHCSTGCLVCRATPHTLVASGLPLVKLGKFGISLSRDNTTLT